MPSQFIEQSYLFWIESQISQQSSIPSRLICIYFMHLKLHHCTDGNYTWFIMIG